MLRSGTCPLRSRSRCFRCQRHRSDRCFLSPAVRHITQTFSAKFLRGDSIRFRIHQPKTINSIQIHFSLYRAELFLVPTETVNSSKPAGF